MLSGDAWQVLSVQVHYLNIVYFLLLLLSMQTQKERRHFKRQTMEHIWTVESLPVAPWWAGCRARSWLNRHLKVPPQASSIAQKAILFCAYLQNSGLDTTGDGQLFGGWWKIIILTWEWKWIESTLMVWAFSVLQFHNLYMGFTDVCLICGFSSSNSTNRLNLVISNHVISNTVTTYVDFCCSSC